MLVTTVGLKRYLLVVGGDWVGVGAHCGALSVVSISVLLLCSSLCSALSLSGSPRDIQIDVRMGSDHHRKRT